MTDVLKLLPPFRWRGIYYPVSARSVSFSHEGVQQKIQYRNGEFPEQLGARDLTFSYSVPMREDLAKGPYEKMFTLGLSTLIADCYNKAEGELVDPVYGTFTCVPTSYSDDLDVLKRDGTDIKLEFTQSPEFEAESTEFQPPGLSGIVSDAGALNEELTAVDWEIQEPPEGTTDLLSAINGVMRQGLAVVNKVDAYVNDVVSRLEKIETTLDAIGNPKNWPLRNTVRRIRDKALRFNSADSANPTKKIISIEVPSKTTPAQFAATWGMSLSDFMRLNKSVATSPTLAAGKSVYVFAK